MAKAPNKMVLEAYKLFKSGLKLVEIANQLNLPAGTVRRWKSVYKWDGERSERKSERSERSERPKKVKVTTMDDGTRETMLNENLTHEQRLFCIYYSKIFNATQAYINAYKCDYETANANGSRLLVKASVREEIQRLNELKRQQIVANEDDLVELHMRIAFADIGNYLKFGQESVPVMAMHGPVQIKNENTGKKETLMQDISVVKLNNSSNVDTQIIQEVKQGRDGVSIKLADKQRSLDWLDRYFLINPLDKHRIAFDNAKLELERKKLEPDTKTEGIRYTGIPAAMIAPAFIKVIHYIQEELYSEYVFPGGRGSAKSSFVSLEIIDLIEKNPELHAAVFRQVGATLRDSVYAQMCWAISMLELEDEYKCNVSPMEITKKSTGQKIFFRGNDDPMKSKGIKAPALKKEAIRRIKVNREKLKELKPNAMKVENGYIGILWFEELDQFKGEEAIRTVTQSVIRGGEKTYIFKSFNPPKSINNWANKYINIPKPGMCVTHSNYLDVPKQWLGKPFLDEAEHLKEANPKAYENEYLGKPVGTGTNVFEFIEVRTITDEEISQFDRIYQGQDWGWYPDPAAFIRNYYNHAQEKIFLMDELGGCKIRNKDAAEKIIEKGYDDYEIMCDIEHKSILDYRDAGLPARAAQKGPGSVEYGMKWLQGRTIVIDPVRTPRAYDEIINYEHEVDKNGNVMSGYPDKDNHWIDALRYSLTPVFMRRGNRA